MSYRSQGSHVDSRYSSGSDISTDVSDRGSTTGLNVTDALSNRRRSSFKASKYQIQNNNEGKIYRALKSFKEEFR